MGTALLAGRDFEPRDNFNASSVAIVNHAFVELISRPEGSRKTAERLLDPQKPAKSLVSSPTLARPDLIMLLSLLSSSPMLRLPCTSPLSSFVPPAIPSRLLVTREAAVHRVDPDQAVSDIQTMETVFSNSVSSPRFQTVLLLVFAALAIALAMIGVYGVVSYSVSQRINEIGIRVALGARSSDVFRLVLREAIALSAIALALGLLASLALGRVLQSLLFEVTPTDPATLASVATIVLGVSILAAALPARRATQVDPLTSLRYE